MRINENFSLLACNTFGINTIAKFFCEIATKEEILELQQSALFKNNPILILGGGSNVLFTNDFNGLVIKNCFLGIEKIKEDDNHVWVKVGAGENWHGFVLWALNENLSGMENLSLIPGNAGASPMQNIGAYGVEIKDFFDSLEAIHLESGETKIFSNADCEFGYRESVFKNKFKNQFIIISVTYRLNKTAKLNTSYGAIESELEKMSVKEITPRAVSNAVIRIRQSKLPDPGVLGNAGSFFKNPEIPNEQFEPLKRNFPDIIAYPSSNGLTKLAAGWLIEQCGLKGYRKNHCGVHEKQALVLVNYGGATGNEIYELSEMIINKVEEKFGIRLHREVNIIA